MKNSYLTFLLITLSVNSFCQNKVDGSSNADGILGYIVYKERYFEINGDKNYFTATLVFDSIKSLHTSHRYGMGKDNGNIVATTGEGVGIVAGAYDKKGTMFYRNTIIREFLMRGKELPPFPAYIVKDNWVDIQWQIKDEFKSINNFKVQKAIGYFRGRTWTAWFAKDISFPFGPAKLHGLPGVILEAGDDKFHYIATKIYYPYKTKERIIKPTESQVWTIEEYVRLMDNFGVYSMLEYHKQGKRERKIIDPSTEESIQVKRKKGTDIIYEWEDKNTKRAIYNKDTLNATVDYEAARQLKRLAPKEQSIRH